MKTMMKRFYRDTDHKTVNFSQGHKQLDNLFEEILAEFDQWSASGQTLLGMQWKRYSSYTDHNWSVELEVLYRESEP